MLVIHYRHVFFILTGVLVALSLVSIGVFGLQIGTDFTGGTLVEVRYDREKPSAESLTRTLSEIGLSNVSVRGAGADGYIVRAGTLAPEARESLHRVLFAGTSTGTITRLSDVGPSIGSELTRKAILAILLVVACIVLYIAFVFRSVSKPVSSWVYGLITIVTLVHDVIVPVGAFALFGYVWGAHIDALFVTAILTVLGYSVHDTIVVFDRTRENLRMNQEKNRKEDFEVVAGRSIEQTLVRSLNTSVTTLAALAALFFVGPEATQDFALTLIVGILVGTYSSIALATPLLVVVAKRRQA